MPYSPVMPDQSGFGSFGFFVPSLSDMLTFHPSVQLTRDKIIKSENSIHFSPQVLSAFM